MDNCWGRAGMFSFVFAALLLAFNWPVLSIPQGNALLGWLFAAWALAIVLLGLAARGAGASCPEPPEPASAKQVHAGQTQAEPAQSASTHPDQEKSGAETTDV